jgi:hypothetical protein
MSRLPANGSTFIDSSIPPSGLQFLSGFMIGYLQGQFQISTEATFTTGLLHDNTNGPDGYPPFGGCTDLPVGVPLYWRYRLMEQGFPFNWTNWFDIWTVTYEVAAPPPIPTLSTPTDGATYAFATPFQPAPDIVLGWNESEGATSYGIQIALDAEFSSILYDGTTSDTSYDAGSFNGGTFYWRINATGTGGTSDWSSAWHFIVNETMPLPDKPILFSPSNNSTDINPIGGSLRWSDGAWVVYLGIAIYVATNSNFSNIVFQSAVSPEIGVVGLPDLLHSTTYYWKVVAQNSNGNTSSDVWNFKTAKPTSGQLVININSAATIFDVRVKNQLFSEDALAFYYDAVKNKDGVGVLPRW